MRPDRLSACAFLLLAIAGCATGTRAPSSAAPVTPADWAGVYAAPPSRDGGAQLLAVIVPAAAPDRPVYRLVIADASGAAIDVVGVARIDGDAISLAVAKTALDEAAGATRALASVERYRFRRVSGRAVLIADEALAALGERGGVAPGDLLIKVSDDAALPPASPPGDGQPIIGRDESHAR